MPRAVGSYTVVIKSAQHLYDENVMNYLSTYPVYIQSVNNNVDCLNVSRETLDENMYILNEL